MKSGNEKIFVKVMRNGFIPQLGICGPIPNPIKITRAQAHSMIVAGIAVYQYFPETQYTEKLTLQNVFGDAKKDEEKKPAKIETKISEPIKPVNLTGVKKEVVPEPVVEKKDVAEEPVKEQPEEKPVEKKETVDETFESETSEEEVADEDETEDESTESTTPVNNNNNQYNNNNNYSKKNKKKHR